MAGEAVVPQVRTIPLVRTPRAWWAVLRAALVVLWVVSAAMSWWVMPREASVTDARADLAAGRVVSYQWGDSWDTDVSGGRELTDTPRLESTGAYGPLFVWRTPDGRIHYAVTDRSSGEATLADASALPQYSGVEAASLGEAALSARVDTGTVDSGRLRTVLVLTALLTALSFLIILVAGPDPVIGTRWFWFWLVQAGPFGLALLYWLARERPWSRTARRPAGVAGKETRLRWYAGIGLGFLSGLLASLVVFGLNRLLGDSLVPHPHS